jgi:hypothetical protein
MILLAEMDIVLDKLGSSKFHFFIFNTALHCYEDGKVPQCLNGV